MQPRTLTLSVSDSCRQGFMILLPLLGMMILLASPAHAQTANLPLDIMMAKFIKAINGPMIRLTYTGCYIFGVYCILKGMLKCVKYSDEGSRGQQKFSGIWGTFLFGSMLISLPTAMATMGNSLGFDSTIEPVLSYANMQIGSQEVEQKITRTYWVIITFVQMLGVISFTRGLSILRSVTDGNTQVTSMAGMTHIVAGAIAWNLGEFVQVLGNTVGFKLVG